jgi:hypothetical protein
MGPDKLSVFRALLDRSSQSSAPVVLGADEGSSSPGASLPLSIGSENEPARNFGEVGGGGNGPTGGNPYGGGGMDPWQNSVEQRLASLDGRLGRIDSTVTETRVDVAGIKSDMVHLPTKDWIGKRLYGGLTVASILVIILANLPKIIELFKGAPH